MISEPDERETTMRAVKVNALCPSCREGDLRAVEGAFTMTDPVQVLHRCTACGDTTYIEGKSYPYITFKDVD